MARHGALRTTFSDSGGEPVQLVHPPRPAELTVTDLGELPSKDPSEPTHAWRVHAARDTQGRFQAAHGASNLTPMVGRDKEVEILLREWQLETTLLET